MVAEGPCKGLLCQVFLCTTWQGGVAPPTGSPLPSAAPARGERRLRQLVLEVLAAEERALGQCSNESWLEG